MLLGGGGGGEKEKEREQRGERGLPRGLAINSRQAAFSLFRENKQLFCQSCDMTVRQSALALTCMRNGDYHGAIIEADLCTADRVCASSPFLLWLVTYCTFSTHPC